jgi:hopanoid biosynthesis associated protein HpnK
MFDDAGDCRMTKRLIITGDDFGLAVPVNEAIERAHRSGVLGSASLLIGAPAAADAIERAHRNPGLRIGLHVAVCDGHPMLAAEQLPGLVDARTGCFRSPIATLIGLFLRPHVRGELEAEIRAQFAAFRATGLPLDHVDGHNNMQLHPVVLPILLRVAREFGAAGMRLSYEPLLASWRAMRRGLLKRLVPWLAMRPWSIHVKRRMLRAGFVTNDHLFGIYDCGAMDLTALLGFIRHLPEGVSEIHCHLATRRCTELDATMPNYRHERELAALTSPELARALAESNIQLLAGFSDLVPHTLQETLA